jgi:MFS family permease
MTSPAGAPAGPGKKAAWVLALLIVINLFNYIDRYNLAAVETDVRNELFAKDDPNALTRMGDLALAFMASYMVIAPLFGWLGDRISRWWIIAFGVFVWTLATGASGMATSYGALFLTRCFVGVGEAAYGPAAPAIIADMYPLERRGKMIAYFYAAIPVGSAMGYTLGGVIADFAGWRWAFYAMVPPGILLAVLCLFMRDPPRGQSESVGNTLGRKPTWRDYRIILKTKSYLFDTLGMTAMSFAIGGVAFWMPTYVYEFRMDGLNRPEVSKALVTTTFGGITVVAGLLSTLAGGWLGDALRTRVKGSYFIVSACGMFLGFFFFLGVILVPFPYAWAFVFLAVFCLFFNTGPTNAILANVTHPSMRPMAVALNIFVIHILGDAFSPRIIGMIAEWGPGPKDLDRGFMVISGMILLSGLLWWWGARYLEEDTAAAPTRLASSSPAP